jgi:hypothetical protein
MINGALTGKARGLLADKNSSIKERMIIYD